jgi:two-component system LytT family response regulator
MVAAGQSPRVENAASTSFPVQYAQRHWSRTPSGDKTHIVRETMRGLETKLCPKTFQRISRSAIVNLERIKELQPMGKGEYVVVLTDGKRLTMSRGIRELTHALEPA